MDIESEQKERFKFDKAINRHQNYRRAIEVACHGIKMLKQERVSAGCQKELEKVVIKGATKLLTELDSTDLN